MELKISRRELLLSGSALGIGLTSPPHASADAVNTGNPIKLIVPFSPGGAADTVARLLADNLRPRLGRNLIIDNKTGAGGVIGTDFVAKAPPDGLTFTVGLTSSLLLNQFLYSRLPYEPQRDLRLVSQLAVAPMTVLVPSGVPAKNMTELRSYLEQNKGKVSYGSYGVGSYAHLVLAYLNSTLNADMVHAAYRGEAAVVQALLSGEVQVAITSGVVSVAHIASGRLRAVGVTGPQRMEALPNIATLQEQGMRDEAYRVLGWVGMAAPAKTPIDIIHRIAVEAAAAFRTPEVKARLTTLGLVASADTPEAFQEIYQRDYPIWQRLAKASGAKLD